MGTVKAYQTKTRGRLYEVWYTKPDDTRGHERGFNLKRDAEAHLATVEVSKLKGAYVNRSDAKATVSTLGFQWLEQHKPDHPHRVTTPSKAPGESMSSRSGAATRWGRSPGAMCRRG